MRFLMSLESLCGATPAPLILELGANEGAYGRVASSMGCRVLSVEPQPSCMRALALAVALTPARRTACLIHAFASDVQIATDMPPAPCSGEGRRIEHGGAFKAPVQAGQLSVEKLARMQPEAGYHTTARAATVRSVAVDALVDEDVLLIKCDVEGGEIGVLRSAMGLFQRRRVHNLLIELKPSGWPGTDGGLLPFDDGWSVIQRVWQLQNFVCASMSVTSSSNRAPGRRVNSTSPHGMPTHLHSELRPTPMSSQAIKATLEHLHKGRRGVGDLDLWCWRAPDDVSSVANQKSL